MDDLNDPDSHQLDMHLCLDHLLVDYVSKNDSFKYNIPKEFDLVKFKEVFIKNYKNTIKGWNSVYFINHDYIRPISKFGDDKVYRRETGKMLAVLTLSL